MTITTQLQFNILTYPTIHISPILLILQLSNVFQQTIHTYSLIFSRDRRQSFSNTPPYPSLSTKYPLSLLVLTPLYSQNSNNRNSHWYLWIHPSRTCFLHSSSLTTPSHSSTVCPYMSSYPSLPAAHTSHTAPLTDNCSTNSRLRTAFRSIPFRPTLQPKHSSSPDILLEACR